MKSEHSGGSQRVFMLGNNVLGISEEPDSEAEKQESDVEADG